MFCAEFITDRVSREGRPKAVDIAPIRLSVYGTFVRLFPLCLLNRLTFELELIVCVCRDHSSPRIEIQGHIGQGQCPARMGVVTQ